MEDLSGVLNLGKELQCSICLSILHAPTARLPCCHYFCWDCITASLRVKPECPNCKAPARRRDLVADEKMDRVAALYARLEASTGEMMLCSQMAPMDGVLPSPQQQPPPQQQQQEQFPTAGRDAVAALEPAGPEQAAELRFPSAEVNATPGPSGFGFGGISWLPGVDDSEYQTPTQASPTCSRRTSLLLGSHATVAAGPPGLASVRKPDNTSPGSAVPLGNAGMSEEGAAGAANTAAGAPMQCRDREQQQQEDGGGGAAGVAAAGEEEERAWQREEGMQLADAPTVYFDADAAMLPDSEASHAFLGPASIPDVTLGGSANPSPAAAGPHSPAGATAAAAAIAIAAAPAGPEEHGARQPGGSGGGCGGGGGSAAAAAGPSSGPAWRSRRSNSGGSGPKKRVGKITDFITVTRVSKRTKGDDDGVASGGSGSRRIPSRLQPWNCSACTFENKGAAIKCDICGTQRPRGGSSGSVTAHMQAWGAVTGPHGGAADGAGGKHQREEERALGKTTVAAAGQGNADAGTAPSPGSDPTAEVPCLDSITKAAGGRAPSPPPPLQQQADGSVPDDGEQQQQQAGTQLTVQQQQQHHSAAQPLRLASLFSPADGGRPGRSAAGRRVPAPPRTSLEATAVRYHDAAVHHSGSSSQQQQQGLASVLQQRRASASAYLVDLPTPLESEPAAAAAAPASAADGAGMPASGGIDRLAREAEGTAHRDSSAKAAGAAGGAAAEGEARSGGARDSMGMPAGAGDSVGKLALPFFDDSWGAVDAILENLELEEASGGGRQQAIEAISAEGRGEAAAEQQQQTAAVGAGLVGSTPFAMQQRGGREGGGRALGTPITAAAAQAGPDTCAAAGDGTGTAVAMATASAPRTGRGTGQRRQGSARGGSKAKAAVEIPHRDGACAFCGEDGTDAAGCGPILELPTTLAGGRNGAVCWVHEQCALWAPQVFQDENVAGGLANVQSEVARSRALACAVCGKGGAALGCANKRCRRSYHLPCARAEPGTHFDGAAFLMWCPHHVPKRARQAAAAAAAATSSFGPAIAAVERQPAAAPAKDCQQQQRGEGGWAVVQGCQEGGSSSPLMMVIPGDGIQRDQHHHAALMQEAAGVAPGTTDQPHCKTRLTTAAVARAAQQQGKQHDAGRQQQRKNNGQQQQQQNNGQQQQDGAQQQQHQSAQQQQENAQQQQQCGQLPAWSGGRLGLVLLGSGLSAQERLNVTEFARVTGSSVRSSWQPDVTHVVCGLDEDGNAKRTKKYLMGVLHGVWLVGAPWLAACRAAGGPRPEPLHQVAGDMSGGRGGPQAGRMRTLAGDPPLLHKFEVHLAGAFKSRDDVQQLVRAAGARLLTRPPVPPATTDRSSPRQVVLFEAPDEGTTISPSAAARPPSLPSTTTGVPILYHKWLMDCIGSHDVLDFGPYVVQQ